MRDAFISTLLQEAETDQHLFLVVGDLGYGVVDQFAKEFPERFLNAGVAEQNMIGVASGLAATGFNVVVYSIANFPTMRCLEQIRNDVCYHELPVTIVTVGAGFAYGTHGYTHHAIEDLAVMRPLPGMNVLCPADPAEARSAARGIATRREPTYIRLGKNGEGNLHAGGDIDLRTPNLVFGVDRSTPQIILIATGAITSEAIEAARILSDAEVPTWVFSCPTIKPYDVSWVASLPDVPLITIEEHVTEGGLGSATLEAIAQSGQARHVRLLGVTPGRFHVSGSQDYLRGLHGLDARSIAATARVALA